MSGRPDDTFVVDPWEVDAAGTEVRLRYRIGGHAFVERCTFPWPVALDATGRRLLDLLAVVAAVSYWKAFVPGRVVWPELAVDPAGAHLAAVLADEGMREFAVTNTLPVPLPVTVDGPTASSLPAAVQAPAADGVRPLLPLGAGRDSTLVLALLAPLQPRLLTVGDNVHARRVAEVAGIPLAVAGRRIDPALLDLNRQGAPNGHVPVTAITSLVAVVAAYAAGCTDVVMANEHASSSPTRVLGDAEVNHQFSKSFRAETLLRAALAGAGAPVRYWSALRPYGELAISRAFAEHARPFHHVFQSCNRAFVRDETQRSSGWCRACPKCRSVALLLAPFLSPTDLTAVMGADLLDDAGQVDGFADLVVPERKPFECVGEVHEARVAMGMLLAHPHWRHHAVVTALASYALPGGIGAATVHGAPHHVPAFARPLLEPVLGPCA